MCRPLFFWTLKGCIHRQLNFWGFFMSISFFIKKTGEIYFMLYSHFQRLHALSWFCSMAKTTRSVNLIVHVTKPYIKFINLFSAQSASTCYHELHLWKAGVSHSYRCTLEVQRLIQDLKTWLVASSRPFNFCLRSSLSQTLSWSPNHSCHLLGLGSSLLD